MVRFTQTEWELFIDGYCIIMMNIFALINFAACRQNLESQENSKSGR